MKLRIDRPEDHKLKDLAPRVEVISGDWRYEWGYALSLTAEDKVRIFLDAGISIDIPADAVLFHSF